MVVFLLAAVLVHAQLSGDGTVEVQRVSTGRTELFHLRLASPASEFDFGAEVARRFGIGRFRLQPDGDTASTWRAAVLAAAPDQQQQPPRSKRLVLHLHDEDIINSPANCVDPFWACEKTNLPQPRGIAANWYWPKALTGNTHPGASLPHGLVSVAAYSGAYPSGYV
jgi:hypothetical protein